MGAIISNLGATLTQCYPPRPTFAPVRDVPDLTGQVMIVTGGNSGIGKLVAKELLLKNANVYIACRSKQKATDTIAELQAATGKAPTFLQLDLASLSSVTQAANEFKSKETELHVLFNSAGVMLPGSLDLFTADGYDLTFGTNLLGHAHFTHLLLPALAEGAKTSPTSKSRIVNTASVSAMWSTKVNYDVLRRGDRRSGFTFLVDRYTESKLAMVLFSNEIARRYADQNIVSVAIDPGNIKTGLARTATIAEGIVINLMQYDAEKYGCLTTLYAGTMPQVLEASGSWVVPWARIRKQAQHFRDAEETDKLWHWIEKSRKSWA